MTDLLAAALAYAEAGIYTFPARVTVVDGRKQVAPVAKWREASSTTAETLRGWFAPGRPWADASLCIDCGRSNLVVIDLDVTGGHDGITAWGALMAKHDIEPTPVRSHTPSGGEHWFYREHPRRVVGIDSSGKVAPGVDVRGLGGFVIAWPSEDARGAYGAIRPADLATVPIVPGLVIERMNARPAAAAGVSTAAAAVTVSPPNDDEFWATFTKRAFTREQAKAFCVPPLETFRALRTPEDSGFNHKLNAVACVWSHFIPAFMTEAQAEAEIYTAAVANRSVEWQGETAVRSTIRSGLRQHSDPWKAVRVVEEAADPNDGFNRVVDLGPFLDGTFIAPEPSVGGERDDTRRMLYPGRWHTVVGLTAAGKSWFALWHALEVMRAGEPVLYLHFEESLPIGTLTRLEKLGAEKDLIRQKFIWLDCTRRWAVSDFSATLQTLSTSPPPALVVLDGINAACSIHGWPVDKPEAVGTYRATFVSPATRTGATVLSLGHPPKNRDRQGERHGFGSTAWLDEVDGVAFRLEATKNPIGRGRFGSSALYSVKDRYGEVETHGQLDDRREAGWHYQGSLVVDDARPSGLTLMRVSPPVRDARPIGDSVDDLAAAILDYLVTVDGRSYPSNKALGIALRAREVNYANNDLAPALELLEMRELIVRAPYKSDTAPRWGRLTSPEEDPDERYR